MPSPNDIMLCGYVVLGLGCAITALVLAKTGRIPGPRRVLEDWARSEGLRIVSAEHRRWRTGPFGYVFKWRRRTRAQSVYRFVVQYPDGRERAGYARIGGFFGMGRAVSVEWDD